MSSNKNLQLKSMYQENDVVTRWKTLKLGDLCRSISETYRNNDSEVILVNTSDVLNGKILNHKKVENKNLKGQFKKTFKKGDILYSEIRPANRRYAYIDFDETDQYIASTKLMVIRPDKSKIVPKFLVTYLSSERVLSELQQLAETRSGTFPQITFNSELAPMPICVPNIEYQKKILSILQPLNDKIELNNAINENLERQAQALYRHMFINNFNNGRQICKVSEYFDISIGKTPPRKETQWFTTNPSDIVWVSISDMGSSGTFIGNSSEYLTQEAVKKFNIKIVPDNTVILSFKLTVGRIAITNGKMTTNEAIAHFKTDKNFINEYLYCYLKNFNYQTMGSTSSIATAVNSKIIKSMPFIVPTTEEIDKFHGITYPMFKQILNNQLENKKLAKLRDALLPKLMSGEIDVSNIKI